MEWTDTFEAKQACCSVSSCPFDQTKLRYHVQVKTETLGYY